MSLKIKSYREIIKWSIWAVVFVLFLIFLIRVATFEASYYNEKEGSERAVPVKTDGDESSGLEDLDETEPTEQQLREYVVSADRPRYLTVEKIGVKKARIMAMGVNAQGELDTPRNVFDVGWYDGSGKPGQGRTMIIDGHNGGPHVFGVFKRLPDLVAGDIITVERGDGVIFKYQVVENVSIPLDQANEYMVKAGESPVEDIESVTLITCTGEWSQQQQTYLSRQFTRATLVED
ncbi:class F sortase [Candidatus Saccharibacteria bacterium]|nr:class F sortase [Candidatus Saccharibacteria bacterium]